MPNGYESPLNRLADVMPRFLLEMQNMKMRQEAQEALNSYREGMLAARIQRNEMMQTVRDEQRRLGAIERGREEREDIFAARAKYGEPGARAIYPEAYQRQFSQGMPPEKPVVEKKTIQERANTELEDIAKYDRLTAEHADRPSVSKTYKTLAIRARGRLEKLLTSEELDEPALRDLLSYWEKDRILPEPVRQTMIQKIKARLGLEIEKPTMSTFEQIKGMSNEELIDMIKTVRE